MAFLVHHGRTDVMEIGVTDCYLEAEVRKRGGTYEGLSSVGGFNLSTKTGVY